MDTWVLLLVGYLPSLLISALLFWRARKKHRAEAVETENCMRIRESVWQVISSVVLFALLVDAALFAGGMLIWGGWTVVYSFI